MRLPAASPLSLNPSTAPPHARIEKAARELETQFAQMLIKSMRSTSMGDSMMGDNSTYRDMYDKQLSHELTKGRGLGLAPMIMRQLERSTGTENKTGTDGAPGAFPLLPQGAATPGQPIPLAVPAGPMPLTALPAAIGPLALATTSSGISMAAIDLPTITVHAPGYIDTSVAGADPACATDTPLDCSSPEKFVQSIWPHAQKVAAELGVPAKALVAQAALETGWGRRLAGREGVTSHNLFGIKAGGRWSGDRMSAATHEFVGGVRRSERADFRAYGSSADSFADYARLLGNDRYAAARGAGNDTHRFASALQQAGYATDPHYAAKITAIANGATINRALASLPGTGSVASAATGSNPPLTGNRG